MEISSKKEEELENSSRKFKSVLLQAMQKIDASKEKELCKYLPDPLKDGSIHHFTMKKMMIQDPLAFLEMLDRYILIPENPQVLPPRKRGPRKSRKEKFKFTERDLERMLEIAKIAGDTEMISRLTPKKSFKDIQRELIISIRCGDVNVKLWNAYVDSVYQERNNALSS